MKINLINKLTKKCKLINKDKIWDSKSISHKNLINRIPNNKKPNRKIKYNEY